MHRALLRVSRLHRRGEEGSRYFAYTDGTPYIPAGINMAFPGMFGKSNGREFGLSGGFKQMGMRQYERWFCRAAASGVDMVRVWIGHPYFSPDTEKAEVLEPVQLAKLDRLVELAKKYGIRLKLTVENCRHFNYDRVADSDSYSDDIFRKFNKKLYLNGERCKNMGEWLTGAGYRAACLPSAIFVA